MSSVEANLEGPPEGWEEPLRPWENVSLCLPSEEDELLERDAFREQDDPQPIQYFYDLDDDARTLRVHLETDPDGYWGGVPREWTITVEPMRSFYKTPVVELEKRCRGETSGWVKKKVAAFAAGALINPKDILTATSTDGEKTFRFSQLRGLILEPKTPTTRTR